MWKIINIRTNVLQYRKIYITHSVKYFTTGRINTKCKKCGTIINPAEVLCFFCKDCNWPVDSKQLEQLNPFHIFKMEPRYKIDRTQLSQEYKRYQFLLHPDKHTSKETDELAIINNNSSIINESYRTLIDDKARAKLCFCIKYGEEEFNNAMKTTDPAQLEQIMEMNEQLDELQNTEEAKLMYNNFASIIQNCVKALENAFEDDDKQEIITTFKTLSFYMQLMGRIKDMYNVSE
ncbi:Fe-S protein assembly co-chaperone HscB [Babesia bovis T2Bo]|uniref:Fe-S protein assembly co-chaperone HscB n=1 Tax=Babesia bovis T2Bo TaxID=484906 RepID=UPI001C35B231|nr:Fe-S protein assembly co-chaperone HscB [Babesia bovis T2Bo]KAG6440048.1 Fe-S protein assembly co-chaperone HscB [Babesia bovis T2Bo]